MGLDFNISPPAWLKEAGQWNDSAGLQAFQVGANLALQRQHLELQQQKAQQDAVAQQAQMKMAQQAMDFKTQEQAAWISDIPKIMDWMKLPPEQQITTPLTGLTSKQGMQTALQFEKAASSGAAAKALTEGLNTYNKRLALTVKADPEVGADLSLPSGQYPSQANWQALSIAEERVKIRANNAAMQAEIDARASGAVPETKIDSTGKVTRTFKAGPEDKNIVPKETTLSDGTPIIYNPNSGHFVLKKEDKTHELTAPQLLSLSKELVNAGNTNDANRIVSFLNTTATNQIAPKTNVPKSPAASPVGGGLNFNDFKNWQHQNTQ